MKAIIAKKYGGPNVLEFVDFEKPSIKNDHVLVKIKAASINQADAYIMQGKPFPIRFMTGLFKPKFQIKGSDISGVIEEVGSNIVDFNVGDEVFGQLVLNQNGGYAEYALMNPKQLVKKSSNVTFSEAAAVPMAGLTALQGARLGGVTKDSKVLIYGASGGVGTFAIQVCKSMGAHVTAVVSTRNKSVAIKSGADIVIDYKTTTWDDDNNLYDVILAVNGYNKLKRYRDKLTDDGHYVIIGGSMKQIFEVMIKKPFLKDKRNRKFISFTAKVSKQDLNVLSTLLTSKKIIPHIDKEFDLKDAKQAMTHFIDKRTIGKTIIKI